MTRFDEGPPRAVPRTTSFPFTNHRTYAQARLYCTECGVKLPKSEVEAGLARCRTCTRPEAG
jgi:hypothetical protein